MFLKSEYAFLKKELRKSFLSGMLEPFEKFKQFENLAVLNEVTEGKNLHRWPFGFGAEHSLEISSDSSFGS
ncbi:MAG: hypothetical protein CL917_12565 [Deltaproteobacteria bacterium]|nr:hypothetical protein [Deltaproteobacteria bacterium]